MIWSSKANSLRFISFICALSLSLSPLANPFAMCASLRRIKFTNSFSIEKSDAGKHAARWKIKVYTCRNNNSAAWNIVEIKIGAIHSRWLPTCTRTRLELTAFRVYLASTIVSLPLRLFGVTRGWLKAQTHLRDRSFSEFIGIEHWAEQHYSFLAQIDGGAKRIDSNRCSLSTRRCTVTVSCILVSSIQ